MQSQMPTVTKTEESMLSEVSHDLVDFARRQIFDTRFPCSRPSHLKAIIHWAAVASLSWAMARVSPKQCSSFRSGGEQFPTETFIPKSCFQMTKKTNI